MREVSMLRNTEKAIFPQINKQTNKQKQTKKKTIHTHTHTHTHTGTHAESMRPVDQIQVEIVQLQLLERLLQRRAHVVLGVLGVPQLARHKDVAPLHQSAGEGLAQCLPDLALVAVHGGAVNVTISGLQSGSDCARDLVV